MISFRYHLVTIVAIFLALGLGVLAGTTVLEQGLVARLENQTRLLTEDLGRSRAEIQEQALVLSRLDAFSAELRDTAAPGRLLEEEVIVVGHELGDAGAMGSAREAVELAGADVRADFTIQGRMSVPDEAARLELAGVLGMPDDTPAGIVRRDAAVRLTERLANGPARAAGNRDQEELLTRLLSAGFVTVEGPGVDETLASIGGPGTIVVVVGGGRTEAEAVSAALVPIVDGLLAQGAPTAAVEPFSEEQPFLEEARDIGDPDLVTVNDVDLAAGQLALVLGLQRRIVLLEGGDYGIGGGLDVIPPLQLGDA